MSEYVLNPCCFIGFIAVCFCCSCANGYDGSLMSSILAMPFFKAKFDSGLVGQKTSLLSALYSV